MTRVWSSGVRRPLVIVALVRPAVLKISFKTVTALSETTAPLLILTATAGTTPTVTGGPAGARLDLSWMQSVFERSPDVMRLDHTSNFVTPLCAFGL